MPVHNNRYDRISVRSSQRRRHIIIRYPGLDHSRKYRCNHQKSFLSNGIFIIEFRIENCY